MSVMEWTRAAKCKDCKFMKAFKMEGMKRNTYYCSNPLSHCATKRVLLSDLVCEHWSL